MVLKKKMRKQVRFQFKKVMEILMVMVSLSMVMVPKMVVPMVVKPELTDNQKKQLENAINKQKKFMDGDISKRSSF